MKTAQTGVYLERNPNTAQGADVTVVSRKKTKSVDEIDTMLLTAMPDLEKIGAASCDEAIEILTESGALNAKHPLSSFTRPLTKIFS
jgi:hypothetical protein